MTVAVCLVVMFLVTAAVITVVVYILRKRKQRLQGKKIPKTCPKLFLFCQPFLPTTLAFHEESNVVSRIMSPLRFYSNFQRGIKHYTELNCVKSILSLQYTVDLDHVVHCLINFFNHVFYCFTLESKSKNIRELIEHVKTVALTFFQFFR